MEARIPALVVFIILLLVTTGGCTDILSKQKVGGFGDVPGPKGTSGTPPGQQGKGSDISGTCYQNCIQYDKENLADCRKACCVADCQPKTQEDQTR
jgi:hypothetical protein